MGEVYTGKIAETEMLGKTEREKSLKISYLPYRSAMALVRQTQPGTSDSNYKFGPSDPEPYFANDLHASIAELLELDNYDQLRYYTAVGSELDRYHGVDAFFDYFLEDPDHSVTITLDLTLNPHKEEYKADVVLQASEEDLDLKGNKKGYSRLVEESANKIANAIKLAIKVNQGGKRYG